MTIVVVRSGGFAGLRREWRVDAGDDDADRWRVLVEACPWDDDSAASEPTPAPGPPPRAADRYVWIIRALTPEQRLETELPEPALTGPWRELVDAVRSVS
ncbi:protealysin inhibitor emfourin [Microbacterium sp. ZKA21]|uniref:protealysin inhibitor emfourin n=1 Tax=Microbacterium sp. ZKA21 TaxID=3381694 RepID=UPI003D1C22AC